MTTEDITNKALDYQCAVCGSEIVKIWDAENDTERWCCAKDHTHNGVKRKLSPQKALARGEADKLLGKGAQKDLEARAKRNQLAFNNLPKVDAGDFSPVTLDKVIAMVVWAEGVGLNAYLGHVELYYGEPRVSIDGYYYLNNQRKEPYRVYADPMTSVDRIAYALENEEIGFLARAYLEDVKLPQIGIGIVRAHELTDMSKKHPDEKRYPVVSEHPQRLAEKRAEWQLFRKLISLEVKE